MVKIFEIINKRQGANTRITISGPRSNLRNLHKPLRPLEW